MDKLENPTKIPLMGIINELVMPKYCPRCERHNCAEASLTCGYFDGIHDGLIACAHPDSIALYDALDLLKRTEQ